MDKGDQQQGASPEPGEVPGGAPEMPPAIMTTQAGPTTPGGPTDGRPGPPAQGPRPLPLITSLAGAAGALFLLISLGMFLSELTGDSRRISGLVVCLLFQALGVGLIVLTRGRASITAGVGLTALGVIPLMVHLFVDVDNPSKTVDSPSSFTSTATMILLASAAAWLVAYLFGPGRRYGIYLGGALVAIWLVAVVQIIDNPINQVVNPFQTETQFRPIGNAIEPGEYYGDNFYEDDFFSDTSGSDDFFVPSQDDGFGSGFDDDFGYEDDSFYGEPYGSVDDPSTKLGWASLLFGGAYLALAAWRDRRGDTRMGTPLVAVAAPILLMSVAFLSSDFGDTGTSMLAIAIGAAQMFVGTRTGRRFTSWLGLLTATFGVVALVDQAVGDSAKVSAIVLLILGVGITLLALALDGGLNLERDGDGPSGPIGPGIPSFGGGGPATAPGGPPWAAADGTNDPATTPGSPWSAPTAPPTAPPSPSSSPPDGQTSFTPPGPPTASSWPPPTLEAPSASPWTSPPPDTAPLWAPPTSDEREPPTSGT